MPLPRPLFLLPAAAVLATAVWAGSTVLARRAQDRSQEWRLLLPGHLPALNPFAPADEAERQILDLLHEPLIRLDRQGRPAPALAEEWRWHLRVSCWFADIDAAQAARTRLLAVPAETRLDWGLEETRVDKTALVLRFTKPDRTSADAALAALAGAEPQALTFLRLESVPGLRDALEAHAASAPAGLHRLWFDTDGACEIVTSQPPLAAREALAAALRPHLPRLPEMRPLAEVAGLAEPVLEFRWSAVRARWPDGRALDAGDVQATVAAVLAEPTARSRDGLRDLQAIEPGEGGFRAVYRRSRGAALAAWIDLPILPAPAEKPGKNAWHVGATHLGVAAQVPPPTAEDLNENAWHLGGKNAWHVGAGAWHVVQRNAETLVLETDQATGPDSPRRLRFFPALPPSGTRLTVAAGGLDAVWPGTASLTELQPWLERRAGPPRGRVLLLWNSRRLGDPGLRAALARAVDRDALVREVAPGRARPLFSHFPVGLWYEPPLPAPAANAEAAREQLARLGWLPDGDHLRRQGSPLAFSLLVPEGNAQRLALAQALAGQWRALGAEIRVEAVPAANLVSDRLATGQFDAVLLGRAETLEWDVADGWHSQRGSLNFTGAADPRLDLLLEALADEFDITRIPERVLAVEQRLRDLHLALPLLGDEPQLGLQRDRFRDRPGASLRELLRPAAVSSPSLQMREPKE